MPITLSSKDNNYFSSYIDIKKISVPSSPNSGIGRIFYSASTDKLSFKKSDGTVVDIETGGGGGTVNSASNVGTGSGWFKSLSVDDLQFKSLVAGSNKLSVTSNTNDLTLDVAEGNLTLSNIGGTLADVQLSANVTKNTSSQTLTNKTVNLTDNTVTDTSIAAGDLAKGNGTKFLRFARGNANEVLAVNSGGTDIAYTQIGNASISASAAIAYSKLNLTGSIVDADISTVGWSKLIGTPTKLDDLSAPDDNTDLNASITKHGLLPKLSGNSTDFLNGLGAWAVPAGSGSGSISNVLSGTSTKSGDASTKVFTIAHGIGSAPVAATVIPSSIDALGDYQVDVDSTNITVTYQSAPPTGTGNLNFFWIAVASNIDPLSVCSKGNATKSGDASTKVFTITHGMGSTPTSAYVMPSSVDALGIYQVDLDATNITITYQVAPPSGTNNLDYYWFAINASGGVVGVGEANTASNVGSGAGVYKQKSTFDLQLRSIIGGTGIDATQNTNDITLDIDSTVATLTGSQTLTNKAINISNNTVTATSRATGDLVKDNGTKYERFAMGSANQALVVNSGGTDLTWSSLTATAKNTATKSGDGTTKTFTIAHGMSTTPVIAFVNPTSVDALGPYTTTVDTTNITITYSIAPPTGTGNLTYYWMAMDSNGGSLAGESQLDRLAEKRGQYIPSGSTVTGYGLLADIQGYYSTLSATSNANGVFHQFVTGTTSGTAAGIVHLTSTGQGITRRSFNPYLLMRFFFSGRSSGDCVLYAGFTTRNTILTSSNNPFAIGESGVLMGFRASDANFSCFSNDGSTGTFTTTAMSEPVASSTSSTYYFGIQLNSSNIVCSLYNSSKGLIDSKTLSSNLPATTDNLQLQILLLNNTTTSKTFSLGNVSMRSDY